MFISLSNQSHQQVQDLTRIMGLVEQDVMLFALQQLHDAKTGKCKIRYPLLDQAPPDKPRKRKKPSIAIEV